MFNSLAKSFAQFKDTKPDSRPDQQAPKSGQKQLDDNRSRKIHVCGYDLEGVSIAGQETCIIVPRCKVAFDIGRCPQRAVYQQTLLITHGHLDHIGGIAFHTSSRSMLQLPPSRIVLMSDYIDAAKRWLELSQLIQNSEVTEHDLLSLEVGQEYLLPSGYTVRPFPTTHTIPSQGYLLYSLRKKLKAELQGKTQEEIRDLRLSGVEVTDTFQVPELAFTGDTTSHFLEKEGMEDVLRARLLIMELTFLDDAVSIQQAQEQGHMHIAEFVANAHKFQNEGIVLIHFSARYNTKEILEHLDTRLPPALRAKCYPFLNGFP